MIPSPPLKEHLVLNSGALSFLKEILQFHGSMAQKKRQKKEVMG
jgi:hypothetical protein